MSAVGVTWALDIPTRLVPPGAGVRKGDKLTAAVPCALLVCVSTRFVPLSWLWGGKEEFSADLRNEFETWPNHDHVRCAYSIYTPTIGWMSHTAKLNSIISFWC